jgi:hypothetical protein
MKKIIRIKESDLVTLIDKIITESTKVVKTKKIVNEETISEISRELKQRAIEKSIERSQNANLDDDSITRDFERKRRTKFLEPSTETRKLISRIKDEFRKSSFKMRLGTNTELDIRYENKGNGFVIVRGVNPNNPNYSYFTLKIDNSGSKWESINDELDYYLKFEESVELLRLFNKLISTIRQNEAGLS